MMSYYASSITKPPLLDSWWKFFQKECSLCKALTRIYINFSEFWKWKPTSHAVRSNFTSNWFWNSFFSSLCSSLPFPFPFFWLLLNFFHLQLWHHKWIPDVFGVQSFTKERVHGDAELYHQVFAIWVTEWELWKACGHTQFISVPWNVIA